jgi:lipopolysaccharide transport system ATP-binding protein
MKAHQGEKEVTILNKSIQDVEHSNISTHEIEFISLDIHDSTGKTVTHVHSEDEITISFSFRSLRRIEDPTFGILIRNRYGVSVFGTNTYLLRQKNDPLLPEICYTISYQMKIPLQPDDYLITVAIDNKGGGTNSFGEYLLRLNDIGTLKVIQNEKVSMYDGITNLHPTICVNACAHHLTGEIKNG